MIKNFKWLLLASLSFVACNSNDDEDAVVEIPITPGTAVLTKYVALGDSFAAGYSDGALFKAGQSNSYVNILAEQFIPAGGVAATNPFMADNIGGLLLGGNVIAGPRLWFNGKGPVPVTGTPTTEVTSKLTGPFSNLGVPGAKSYHLLAAGYGNVAGVASGKANPYYARFATSGTATVLADALTQVPTFFSLFIGGNDVLGYATSGGIGVNQTGNLDPSTYGGNDITDPNVFANVYNTLATNLTANGAKGVVANLPYVTTLPYFTTVPFNPVPLVAAQVSALNSAYAAYNQGLVGAKNAGLITEEERLKRTIKFIVGNNSVVIVDEYLKNLAGLGLPSYRQTAKGDLIVLFSQGESTQEFLKAGNGTAVPLQDRWVLSQNEVAEVKVATDAYNVTIAATAESKGLAFVDAKAAMTQLSTTGVRFGNYHMSAGYVTGGAFSLDGVHPSARGYAFIANLFVDAINTKFGATLRKVDLANYQIQYPKTIQ